MNKYLSKEQHAKLMAQNTEYVDMLLREMNTKTWTPSSDGRRKGKDRVIQTLQLLVKLQALIEGTGRNAEMHAKRHAAEMEKMDAEQAMQYAMQEAAKINEKLGRH